MCELYKSLNDVDAKALRLLEFRHRLGAWAGVIVLDSVYQDGRAWVAKTL